MKVQIEIIGHAPKQKVALMRMLKEFADDIPNHISIGSVKFKEIKPTKRKKTDGE